MLEGFMIMPEQIVRQLELLKADKALGPDELHPRTEMEAASGIESFGRDFLIHLQGWGGSRGLGKEGIMQLLYISHAHEKIQCQCNSLVRI